MPLLAHDVIGDAPRSLGGGPRSVVFLHGILGSRNNWKSFAKRVVDGAPNWRALVVDLRNHGESHGFARPHTVEACADDVRELIRALGGADVVVGHSYGGKVALALALAAGGVIDRAPAAIWSLDCPPGTRAFDGSEIGRVLDAIRSVPLPIESRRALVDTLRARGLSEPLAQWMTTNMRPLDAGSAQGAIRANDGASAPQQERSVDAAQVRGFAWKFDLAAVDEMLSSFGALDLWPVVEDREARAPGVRDVVIVRGSRSDRFSSDDIARVHRAVARGSVVEHVVDAGHWLHTDNPDALYAVLAPALARYGSAA